MSPRSRDPSNAAIHSHDSRPWVHCRRAWLRGRPLVATATGLHPVHQVVARSPDLATEFATGLRTRAGGRPAVRQTAGSRPTPEGWGHPRRTVPVQPPAVEIPAGLKAASSDKRTLASRPPRDASEPSWYLTMTARCDRQPRCNRPHRRRTAILAPGRPSTASRRGKGPPYPAIRFAEAGMKRGHRSHRGELHHPKRVTMLQEALESDDAVCQSVGLPACPSLHTFVWTNVQKSSVLATTAPTLETTASGSGGRRKV
jgi:hypothetical protein